MEWATSFKVMGVLPDAFFWQPVAVARTRHPARIPQTIFFMISLPEKCYGLLYGIFLSRVPAGRGDAVERRLLGVEATFPADGTDMRKTGHFQGSFPENAQMK